MTLRIGITLAIAFTLPTLALGSPLQPLIHEQVLHSFGEDDNGAYPISSLVADSQGNLYGTTNLAGSNGSGTIFELTPTPGGDWTFTLLHTFTGDDGGNPRSGLLLDQSGNLYGTTANGGSSIYGTVFELSPGASGWTFNVIHTFTGGDDGGFPSGDLIYGGNGILYGATGSGGGSSNCTFGCGTVFQLQRSSLGQWTEKVLYSFQGATDGAGPLGPLARDSAGNLYGVAAQGSQSQCPGGCGMVFRLHQTAHGSWQKQTVLAFGDRKKGWFPNGGLTFDRAGNLYGTTSLGGDLSCNPPNGCGIVFKINSTGKETVVHSFTGNGDGMLPETGLTLGPAGHLLGTTAEGGNAIPNCEFGCGTVFDVAPSGKVVILYPFGGSDGLMPLAPVFWDGAGHVYGTTLEGGTGFAGNVFELTR